MVSTNTRAITLPADETRYLDSLVASGLIRFRKRLLQRRPAEVAGARDGRGSKPIA